MASKSTVDFSLAGPDKKDNLVKNVILIGRVGAGKSATANTLCGSKTFKSLRSSCPVTENILSKTVQHKESGTLFCIIDTPGISGSTDNDAQFLYDLKKSIQSCNNGLHAILVVLSLRESFSQAVQNSFAYFSSILGCNWEKFGILVFTNADILGRSEKSQKKYISKSEKYSNLVLRFNERYITIDNTENCQEQRSKLFSLILEHIHHNEPSVYTKEYLITESKFRTLQEGSDDEKMLKRILQEKRNERERQLKEQQERDILVLKKQTQQQIKNPGTMVSSDEADSKCPARVVPNEEKTIGDITNQAPEDRTQTSLNIIQDLGLENKGYITGIPTNQPPVDPITSIEELIEFGNKETEEKAKTPEKNECGTHNVKLAMANDEISSKNTKECEMCDEIHSLPIFCKKCDMRICRNCANLHKKIPKLRSHRLEDNVLEHKQTHETAMEYTICTLSAKCSTANRLECGKAEYICFQCNRVFCNTCVGQHKEGESQHKEGESQHKEGESQHREGESQHKSINANKLRIYCRKKKDAFEKVLKVGLSLRKRRTICDLYFHSDVVFERGYHKKDKRYLLVKHDELKSMGNLYTFEEPETRENWQKTFRDIICEIKSQVNKILQIRFIHLQDEDIMWIMHDTNVLRQAARSGFSRDDMKKLDPTLMFADE